MFLIRSDLQRATSHGLGTPIRGKLSHVVYHENINPFPESYDQPY